MGTAWSNIGRGMMGLTDIDTGSFIGLRTAFKEENGVSLTKEQEAKAKDLVRKVTDENTSLKSKVDELTKIIEDSAKKQEKLTPKGIKEKTQKIANAIRQGKIHKPGMFSAASPASLAWDAAIEVAAKSFEITGKVAQAIADGVAHLKESEWYKNATSKEKTDGEKFFAEHMNNSSLAAEDIHTRFINKTDSKFSPQDVKDIWKYTKENYIDQGKDFHETLSGVATDLGLKPSQIANALSAPKGARAITDEMFKSQRRRIQAVNDAKEWVKTANTPKMLKFLKRFRVPSFN